MRKIYLDNAATTPVDKRVLAMMKPYWSTFFANPSSIHTMGLQAKRAVEEARKIVATFVGGNTRGVIFTSGGTEANNLAIFGIVKNFLMQGKKIHIITTEIEHSSILEAFAELEKSGCEVSYIKVDESGRVNPKDIRECIRAETIFISVGHANSEIGTIQPIKEIMKEVRFKRNALHGSRFGFPYVHIDASQSAQYESLAIEELGVDLITLDAQKIYGPKGIGALYVRDSVVVLPIIFGGGQEGGRRSGTENVPLIVGFAKALTLVEKVQEKERVRVVKLRNEFFDGVKKFIPQAVINGDRENRLSNNINISIPGQDGEMLVLRLDEAGIVCSSASACASGTGESVIVRKIIEKTHISSEEISARASSVLRFSLGRETKKADILKSIKILQKVITFS